MSFTAPPAPTIARKPFDLSKLPPEMQQRIQAEGSLTAEDGSTIYADGTFTGAGDSANDFGSMAGAMGGAPVPALGAEAGLVADAGASTSPLAGPQFERYFTTANAAFPGTPGGVGGGPAKAPNPMLEPTDPFATAPEVEAQQPFLLSAPTTKPPADAIAARRQMGGAQPATPTTGTYGGRYGRRQVSRASQRR